MTDLTLTLSRYELTTLARALGASAGEAYDDERLHTAKAERHLAARLWIVAGYPENALVQSLLADDIGNELAAIAAGEEENV